MIMGVIKGVLKEVLENSRDMLKRYQEEIVKIKGCLIIKKIGKRYYYYLVKRQGKKVKFIYKGPISEEVKKAYAEQRKRLNKYKRLLLQVKNQIKFIRRALRGKETI
jgi:DNA repair exonuclease SbcCD ATPase subunit